MDADLKHALFSPKHDPLAMLAYLSAETRNIGLAATASTTFYQPWQLARTLSTIDSLSDGRVAWNIVTATVRDAAANFGVEFPDPSVRYVQADEFTRLMKALWDSWDPDALVADAETGVYVDPSKVRAVEFEGEWHRSRGPLNTLPSPQGRPVLLQAGASEQGLDFAARHAEVVFALTYGGIEGMVALRRDLDARLERCGRRRDAVKIFWAAPIRVVHPGDPEIVWDDEHVEAELGLWSQWLDVDLARFDPDQPFPADVEVPGSHSLAAALKMFGQQGLGLRDSVITAHAGSDSLGLVGPAKEVAANLVAAMDEVGGDGVMMLAAGIANAEHVRRITEELVPELRALGAVRTSYSGRTLRENLFAF